MWLVPALPLCGLYTVAQRAVLEEIRQHARGVASAAALGWDAALLDQLESDMRSDTPAYRRAQAQLQQIRAANPTVRYLYVMRRARRPLAPATAYEYVVDAPAQDFNGNGRMDRDEASEQPGAFYDATALPEMVRGWTEPAADLRVSPDPPYPDVLSGYAPIRDARGWTRALVGVDVSAQTGPIDLQHGLRPFVYLRSRLRGCGGKPIAMAAPRYGGSGSRMRTWGTWK